MFVCPLEWFSMKSALLIAIIVISRVLGVYSQQIDLNTKLNNSNCYLSQCTVELFSNVQTLQKYSIKKLNTVRFKTLFDNCIEYDVFLYCTQ